MKKRVVPVLAGLLFCLGGVTAPALIAAQTPGGIKASDNKIYAQKLVNELMAGNHDLMAVGLHAVPPGAKDQVIIAQTDDIIGTKDSPGDLEVTNLDQLKIYPSTLGGKPRMKVMVPFRDSAGRKLGLLVLSFTPGPAVTAFSVHVRTLAILAELAGKIPDLAALFQPASLGPGPAWAE